MVTKSDQLPPSGNKNAPALHFDNRRQPLKSDFIYTFELRSKRTKVKLAIYRNDQIIYSIEQAD